MSRFSRAHQRMNRVIEQRMADGTGSFQSAGGVSITGLHLAVDSSFELAGVMEKLAGSVKAISVSTRQLKGAKPVRGDHFELCGKRYMIEDTLHNDAHFPVYACQETQ